MGAPPPPADGPVNQRRRPGQPCPFAIVAWWSVLASPLVAETIYVGNAGEDGAADGGWLLGRFRPQGDARHGCCWSAGGAGWTCRDAGCSWPSRATTCCSTASATPGRPRGPRWWCRSAGRRSPATPRPPRSLTGVTPPHEVGRGPHAAVL